MPEFQADIDEPLDPVIVTPAPDLPSDSLVTEEEEVVEEPPPEPKKKTNMALILGVAALGLLIVSKR